MTWTGGYAGGLASGMGTLMWVRGSEENKHSGLLQNGKKQSFWVYRYADGEQEHLRRPLCGWG